MHHIKQTKALDQHQHLFDSEPTHVQCMSFIFSPSLSSIDWLVGGWGLIELGVWDDSSTIMNCNVNDDVNCNVNDVRNRTQPLDASPFSIDVQILDDFGTLVEGPMLNELDFNVTLSVSQTTNCGIESLPVR